MTEYIVVSVGVGRELDMPEGKAKNIVNFAPYRVIADSGDAAEWLVREHHAANPTEDSFDPGHHIKIISVVAVEADKVQKI